MKKGQYGWELTEEDVSRIWDDILVPTWRDMCEIYEEQIELARKIIIRAAQYNLTDKEVSELKAFEESMRELVRDFAAVHEYADQLEERVEQPLPAFDATTWYAGWTSGWNAQRDGKSMAECPIAFERFKSSLDRDPFLDEDPFGGRVSSEMAMEDEEALVGTPQETEKWVCPSPKMNGMFIDPDTGMGLPVDKANVQIISTDCNGDLLNSHTEHFKLKDENEMLRRRIAKLEGAVQQLWEDTAPISDPPRSNI